MSRAVHTSSPRRPGPRSAAGPVALSIAVLSTILLTGCSTTAASDSEGGESEGRQVRIPTQPIDGIALNSDVTAPLPLSTAPETVTFTWQGLMAGQPVAHDDCVGMVALTNPEGLLITLDPSLRSCTGSTQLPLDAEAGGPLGDYRISVMLNGLDSELIFPVTS